MKISPVQNLYSFKAQNKDENPISKKGETALLVKGTFIAGLGVGARLLFELMDDDFIVDNLGKKARKINQKNKGLSFNKKLLTGIGIWAGLIMMFIGGFAGLYTLFKAPKIKYDSKINAFQKGKDMDVYIKGNAVEKELYSQMNEKAKTADADEKAKLQKQYMQMQMAKNKVPDFVKLKK
jgi:hypothetical protein